MIETDGAREREREKEREFGESVRVDDIYNECVNCVNVECQDTSKKWCVKQNLNDGKT